jgi:hypothetical protein
MTTSTTTSTTTARQTGLAYAGLAVTGIVGYLAIRSQLYVNGDAATTTANLVAHEGLARVGVAVDLAAVVTQAVAALWFLKLFRRRQPFAALAIAAFGMVNAVVMLVGTMFSATALEVALGGAATTAGDRPATALLMYDLSDAAWRTGGLFFGLWLIPMGWCVLRSGSMPRPLGWILMAGGAGYLVSTFVDVVAVDASTVVSALTLPASVGEFWMVGYLLLKGTGATTTRSEVEVGRPPVTAP